MRILHASEEESSWGLVRRTLCLRGSEKHLEALQRKKFRPSSWDFENSENLLFSQRTRSCTFIGSSADPELAVSLKLYCDSSQSFPRSARWSAR
mmetsp:Transcript_25437/g.38652  ORF Transcript_25437/g.38652 Transcript_25437/m.38652 type:complete len:94 (-) Transcript_25437:153-434(-)